MRHPRLPLLATLVTIGLVLVACEPEPADEPVDEPPPAEQEAPDAAPDLEDVEVVDGVFSGEGIILPVPDGWEIDPAALAEGIVVAVPGEAVQQAILAVAGVEAHPFLGFQGMDYEGALDVLRDLDPESEPVRDEDVDLVGAAEGRLLLLESIEGQAGVTDELILLAQDDAGQIGLFNYSAPAGEIEDAIVTLLVDEAGLDPDSEPTIPELPAEPAP